VKPRSFYTDVAITALYRSRISLLVLATVALFSFLSTPDLCSASDVDLNRLLESARACETCRLRADSLGQIRERLFRSADSLSFSRREMISVGDESAERRLLAMGQALAESIQVVAQAQMAHELVCAPLIDRYFESIATMGIDLSPRGDSANQAAIDSLLLVRNRLQRHQDLSVTTIKAPEIAGGDTSENLRWKAIFTRDLADRVSRWLRIVNGERERLDTRQRLYNESRALLGDEQFLDPTIGFDNDGQEISEFDLPQADGLSAIIEELLRQMPEAAREDSENPLTEISNWLIFKRQELIDHALGLEAEAQRRERER